MTAGTHAGKPTTEQPILWLGMSGFAPEQRQVLEASLTRSPGSPSWRTCAFGDADAWFVNGGNVRVMPDGNLKVAPGLPTERALNLNLSEVDRPVAFGLPLASHDFEPRCTFYPGSEASIHGTLAQFEGWLRMLRAEFVLGAQLIERTETLLRAVYHVSHNGSLLAVLDLHEGKCAISPGAHPVDLWEADWAKRPVGARDIPPGFVPVTPARLAWAYVRRTDRDLLPPRYRTDPIFYRHVPRVPVRWLHDSQLLLLRELSVKSGTFDSLLERTGFSANYLAHHLSCLYYATAIATTPGPSLDVLPSNESHWGRDLTAPAVLERRPHAPKSTAA